MGCLSWITSQQSRLRPEQLGPQVLGGAASWRTLTAGKHPAALSCCGRQRHPSVALRELPPCQLGVGDRVKGMNVAREPGMCAGVG